MRVITHFDKSKNEYMDETHIFYLDGKAILKIDKAYSGYVKGDFIAIGDKEYRVSKVTISPATLLTIIVLEDKWSDMSKVDEKQIQGMAKERHLYSKLLDECLFALNTMESHEIVGGGNTYKLSSKIEAVLRGNG